MVNITKTIIGQEKERMEVDQWLMGKCWIGYVLEHSLLSSMDTMVDSKAGIMSRL